MTKKTSTSGRVLRWFVNIILAIIFIISVQYFKIEIFHKEKNTAFSGKEFYNPYEDYDPATLKANFHVHSKAEQVPKKIYDHYRNKGYDIISISDYQRITSDSSVSEYIPVYEHGYNLKKSHQLVINSDKVTYFDFSLGGNYHTEQQVLNKLKQKGGLLVLAHPSLNKGYRENDFQYLKGYDFIEVFNNYAVSVNIWDAALTNGYPAWILSNDDCHDITKSNLSFNNWTRIGTREKSKEEILGALKKGCHYGVRNLNHDEKNFLDSCILKEDEISVFFRHKADRISFVADNGIVKKEVMNVASASYKIGENDKYIRIESEKDEELIYLNPLIRYDGFQLNHNSGFGLVNSAMTILARLGVLIINLSVLVIILIVNGLMVVRPRLSIPSVKGNREVALG